MGGMKNNRGKEPIAKNLRRFDLDSLWTPLGRAIFMAGRGEFQGHFGPASSYISVFVYFTN